MEQRAIRRSGRINLEIPIRVSGRASDGNDFLEETKTIIVSKYGAKVLLSTSVLPEEVLKIHYPRKNKKGLARIVWTRELASGSSHVGIEFINSDEEFWGIEFPTNSHGEGIVASFLLECSGCHSHRVFDLDDYEMNQLKSDLPLMRPCSRCSRLIMWYLPRA